MPRPLQTLAYKDFLGEYDGVPAEAAQGQAATVQNLYKEREALKRRKGFTALAAALSPAQSHDGLHWYKIVSTEHLVAAHDGDLVDWLHATPGTTLANSTDKLTSGTDANGAMVDGLFYWGDGVKQNIRHGGQGALLTSLQAHWKLDEASGTRADSHGSNTLTDNNTVTQATGKIGSAASFVRANSESLSTADTASLSMGNIDFSIACWVRFSAGGAVQTVMAKSGGASPAVEYSLYRAATNRIRFYVDNGAAANADVAGPALQNNRWYFVVAWHDAGGDTINVQVDNGAVASAAYASGSNDSAHPFSIGGDFGASSFFCDARIDSASVWKRLLTAQERALLWNRGIGIDYPFNPVAQALTDTPNTAPAVANGGGTGPTGTFSYFVTFISADGHHSPVSPESADITLTDDAISLTSIPTCPTGQDCVGRGVWRNANGTTTYYLVDTVNDNTTTTYTDTTTDSVLTVNALLADALGENRQNLRMPPCRYLIAHQNRMVGALCTTSEGDRQTVFLSNYREPWYCPLVPDLDDPNQGSRFPLQGPGAGEVTGLASHGNQVAVFTADAAWLLTTSDQLLDYTLHRFSNHGCVAHRTIASVKDRLIWASSDGIYMAQEGGGVTRISEDIKATYQAIAAADLAKAHAFIWDDKYVLCWPANCRVFDLRYGIWTRNTNWNWRVSAVTALGNAVEKIYAAQTSVARVFQLESGTDDNGTAITAKWESHDFDMGQAGREKRLHYIHAHWKTASGTATVRAYKGTGTTAIQTATKDISLVDDAGGTVSSLRQRCVEQARGERFRIEVEYAGAASDYQLLQVETLFHQAT